MGGGFPIEPEQLGIWPSERISLSENIRDLCKTPICGAFLRCVFMPFRVLLARLPNSMLCLRSLRCYALNCIHICGFCKGLIKFDHVEF